MPQDAFSLAARDDELVMTAGGGFKRKRENSKIQNLEKDTVFSGRIDSDVFFFFVFNNGPESRGCPPAVPCGKRYG